MTDVTGFGLLCTPVFFAVIQRLFHGRTPVLAAVVQPGE